MQAKNSEFTQLLAAIELSRQPGVGAKKFKELIEEHQYPTEALNNHPVQIPLLENETKTGLSEEQRKRLSEEKNKLSFTYFGAQSYPWPLRQMTEPPPYLFYKGPLWPIPALAVAIVGPRQCTDGAAKFAFDIASNLAALGVVIISGGAKGIDAAAHQGALSQKGMTVLVTATGLDRIYPKENEDLFKKVAKTGCILTELLPGTPPRRDFFPTRNRIIVGLSDAVIIVEGQEKSGTFSSACHAKRLKRPIFTWLGSSSTSFQALPEKLIQQGANELPDPDPKLIMQTIKNSSQL